MNVIGIIIFISVFFLGISVISNLIKMKMYSEYLENKTVFYNIERPDLTCTIEDINFSDIDNQRMEILVRYPSGNKIVVFTTMKTFEEIWTIYK